MAEWYDQIASQRGVQQVSPTRVLDVETVTFRTKPTGVYADFPVPLPSWQADQGEGLLNILAEQIEGLIAAGKAVGATYRQDQGDDGLITDYIDFLVRYTPPGGLRGPFEQLVPVPESALLADVDPFFARLATSPESLIAAAYDQLVAAASQ